MSTKHAIPEPYCWDASFCVFFKQLDDEHMGLFEGVFACCNANNQKNLDALKGKVKAHFTNEEKELTRITGYDVASHAAKHNEFLGKITNIDAPLDASTIDYVKDWLVNHIKNTDFTYKGKL